LIWNLPRSSVYVIFSDGSSSGCFWVCWVCCWVGWVGVWVFCGGGCCCCCCCCDAFWEPVGFGGGSFKFLRASSKILSSSASIWDLVWVEDWVEGVCVLFDSVEVVGVVDLEGVVDWEGGGSFLTYYNENK